MNSRKRPLHRRQFLRYAAAASGLLLARQGQTQSRPCPPVIDGTKSGSCQVDAESDWIFRSGGPGVKWAHNFASDEEVKYWLWVGGLGDDPNRSTTKGQQVTRDTADGVTGGGCLKINRPAGSVDSGVWWRPMSAMEESGRGVPDIGWSEGMPTIAAPKEGSLRIGQWAEGNYGPASTGDWDGSEYYLQVRIKLDPRRRDTSTSGGKIMYLTRTERSLTAQEIVTYYRGGSPHLFGLYKAGSPAVDNELEYVDHIYDEWATYLFHIVPGDEHEPNTIIEVWRALSGESTYTKVFQRLGESIDYQDTLRKAWNAVLLSAYHNGAEMPGFWQKYDEIIFSSEYIPPPAV